MKMKTGHIADLHHNPERSKRVMYVLDQVKEIAPDLNLFTNSGENFHNPYNFTERSGFGALLDAWESITRITPVATIRATQGRHERPGMVETLRKVGVSVLKPGGHYGLARHRIWSIDPSVDTDIDLQIFGVPHAHKAHILAAKESMSRDEANQAVNTAMRQLLTRYGAMRASLPDVPALAIGHGVVSGKATRDITAISASSIYSTEADLASMGCDFYAWGHYHNPVEFEDVRGGYLGSFAWDFNECDYKPAITIVDWDSMKTTRHELNINMRRVFRMHPGEALPDMSGCDVHLVNNQTEWTEADCKAKGAGQVKVTTEVEIERKVRSAEVVTANSYQDKYKAVYPDATERELAVCEQFWEQDVSEGRTPQEKTIVPLWLEIRGSKAVMEGSGKEVIRLEYENLSDKITMLIGAGGTGKSALFDLSAPHSVLFLQPHTLLSTFELGDSYIKQGWLINGQEYRIEKLFKPTLKTPKAEYFAFCGDQPIPGLSGNRAPFDEWCVSMFGHPRKFAAFVLNTQFDDNSSKFMGQPINPSLFQSTNVELKALFHELAGTDLKHLETRCRDKAKVFEETEKSERKKREGAEERLPDYEAIRAELETKQLAVNAAQNALISAEANEKAAQTRIESYEKTAEANRNINAVIESLEKKLGEEQATLDNLNRELSAAGDVDIEAASKELSEMEISRFSYDTKMKSLPDIQAKNAAARKAYDAAVSAREASNKEITENNASIDKLISDKELSRERLASAKASIKALVDEAHRVADEANRTAESKRSAKLVELNHRKDTVTERIANGNKLVASIKPCSNCGYLDDEDKATREKYKDVIRDLQIELSEVESQISSLPPVEVVGPVTPDTSVHDETIRKATEVINSEIPERQTPIPVVTVPEYQDETIPSFDTDRYQELKRITASDSKDRMKELNTRISDVSGRIASIRSDVAGEKAKIVVLDESIKEALVAARDAKTKAAGDLRYAENALIAVKTRKEEAEKARESLAEYDAKIEKAHSEWEFWDGMRQKWGPRGVPARILEHTGPYVDKLANDILAEFYPKYRVHSQTTKMSSDGKQELEIFTINAVNQETGREKPISSLSGEERQFIKNALRHAFRTLNQQNSLETWGIAMEDEPDSHVSEGQLGTFWDMVEATTTERSFCISHSPEIKHRSQVTINIESL